MDEIKTKISVDTQELEDATDLIEEVYGRYDITGQGMVPPEIKPVRHAFIETCWALKYVLRKYSRNVSKIIEAAEPESERNAEHDPAD